jgi:hypothetical protein
MTIKPKSFSIEEDHWEEFKEIVESRAGKNKCSNVLTSFIELVTQGYIQIQTDSNLLFLDRYKFESGDLYDLKGESEPVHHQATSLPAPERISEVEFSSLTTLDIKSHPDWIRFSGETHQKTQQFLVLLENQQRQIEGLKTELSSTPINNGESPGVEYPPMISEGSITLVSDFSKNTVVAPETSTVSEELEEVHYPTVHLSEEIQPSINRLTTSFNLEPSTEPESTTLVLSSVPEIRSWMPWDNVVTELVVTSGVPLIPSTEPILLLKSTLRVLDCAPQFDGEVEQCKKYLQACLQESYENPNYRLSDDLNLMLEKALVISGINGMH